ncbi:hypothetical protein P153DRAFT_8124 [Dothidotthia symphoricarpi CBS 119687]|uniref:Uncharacterized protein n=1 Tax=Dothidotthia symphoricarpi CBS 119687 TaxID=1392245 RepID=A0A6A6AUU6_9PLEO|nr:uncharacterized protein P153DRAFT_8124 [Dothidotthia symphoricarpi CBS 119687]KAF2134714.1 hypothetical protein P153DRAFT_8124 [Dothidotthia symphoricarpi CBS 119687]
MPRDSGCRRDGQARMPPLQLCRFAQHRRSVRAGGQAIESCLGNSGQVSRKLGTALVAFVEHAKYFSGYDQGSRVTNNADLEGNEQQRKKGVGKEKGRQLSCCDAQWPLLRLHSSGHCCVCFIFHAKDPDNIPKLRVRGGLVLMANHYPAISKRGFIVR